MDNSHLSAIMFLLKRQRGEILDASIPNYFDKDTAHSVLIACGDLIAGGYVSYGSSGRYCMIEEKVVEAVLRYG
jgi:hypothetical protein